MPSARRKPRSGSSSRFFSCFKNGARVRDLYPSRLSRPSSTPDLYWENDPSSSSSLDYLDPDTEVESESKPDTFEDANDKLQE